MRFSLSSIVFILVLLSISRQQQGSAVVVTAFSLISTTHNYKTITRRTARPVTIGLSNNKKRRLLISSLKLSAADGDNDENDDGVVELADAPSAEEGEKGEDEPVVARAPFFSQGEIDQEALNPDLTDGKQARVVIYIVLSLLPVLFLIPFMLSRELIPLDQLPPVDIGGTGGGGISSGM